MHGSNIKSGIINQFKKLTDLEGYICTSPLSLLMPHEQSSTKYGKKISQLWSVPDQTSRLVFAFRIIYLRSKGQVTSFITAPSTS